MKSTKYYLSQSNNPICSECAEESELESGRPLKERKNGTGNTLECIACDEQIPSIKKQEQKKTA